MFLVHESPDTKNHCPRVVYLKDLVGPDFNLEILDFKFNAIIA